MPATLKIAALQMVSTPDVARNLDAAARLIAEAAAGGARLVALPEYFCLLGRGDRDKIGAAEADASGPIQDFLAATARRHRLWLVGGTLPIRSDTPAGATTRGTRRVAGTAQVNAEPVAMAVVDPIDAAAASVVKVRNACCVWGPDGQRVARYDKIHLFAFDNGREHYDEGRVLEPGNTPLAFDAESWRVGLSVCYDLRFPELYRQLMHPPCDLIVVPSAFTYTTGAAHWELLLRARAVENQCYVLAPAQGGRHENGRRTFGHSLLAGPWGEVLACRPEGEGIIAGEVDRARLAEVRRQLPALAHRRLA